MSYHDPRASAQRQLRTTLVGRGVEVSRVVDRVDGQGLSPAPYVVVRRHDEHFESSRGADDALGETSPERGACSGVELLREPRLSERERTDRYDDAGWVHRHHT